MFALDARQVTKHEGLTTDFQSKQTCRNSEVPHEKHSFPIVFYGAIKKWHTSLAEAREHLHFKFQKLLNLFYSWMPVQTGALVSFLKSAHPRCQIAAPLEAASCFSTSAVNSVNVLTVGEFRFVGIGAKRLHYL
jgi:hypothetical protein